MELSIDSETAERIARGACGVLRRGCHAARRISPQHCYLDGPRFRGGFIAAHSIRVRRLSAAVTSHNITTCHAETFSPRPTLPRRSKRRLQHNQEWSRRPSESNYPQRADFIPRRIEHISCMPRRNCLRATRRGGSRRTSPSCRSYCGSRNPA